MLSGLPPHTVFASVVHVFRTLIGGGHVWLSFLEVSIPLLDCSCSLKQAKSYDACQDGTACASWALEEVLLQGNALVCIASSGLCPGNLVDEQGPGSGYVLLYPSAFLDARLQPFHYLLPGQRKNAWATCKPRVKIISFGTSPIVQEPFLAFLLNFVIERSNTDQRPQKPAAVFHRRKHGVDRRTVQPYS